MAGFGTLRISFRNPCTSDHITRELVEKPPEKSKNKVNHISIPYCQKFGQDPLNIDS